jgi:cytoskeletal protein CcmA (bactofilin family)
MFGSSKNTEETKNLPAAGSSLNAFVKGTVVEGNVRCESDLRIDGTIKGKLVCTAKVIIGPTGSVEGEVKCQNAVVEGQFKGIMQVQELLNVKETADISGEISTGKLLVQSGAKFNVSCKMDQNGNGAVKNLDTKPQNNTADAAAKVFGGKAEVRN